MSFENEEEHRDKLGHFYGSELAKLQGKRMVLRQMKTINKIPLCALKFNVELAHDETGDLDKPIDLDAMFPDTSQDDSSDEEELFQW